MKQYLLLKKKKNKIIYPFSIQLTKEKHEVELAIIWKVLQNWHNTK